MTSAYFLSSLFAVIPSLIAFFLIKKYKPYLFKKALFFFGIGILITPLAWLVEDSYFRFFGIDISQKLIFIQSVLVYGGIAFIEELAKFLSFYFGLKFKKRDYQAIDLILLLVVLAIGFATVENILFVYQGIQTTQALLPILETLVLRYFGSNLNHVLCALIIGLFFVNSIQSGYNYPLFLGYLLAALAHFLFNLLVIISSGGLIIVESIIIVGLIIFVIFKIRHNPNVHQIVSLENIQKISIKFLIIILCGVVIASIITFTLSVLDIHLFSIKFLNLTFCNGSLQLRCSEGKISYCPEKGMPLCCDSNQSLALDTQGYGRCCNKDNICNNLCYTPCDTGLVLLCDKKFGGICCKDNQKIATGQNGIAMCCDEQYICNGQCFACEGSRLKFICDKKAGGFCCLNDQELMVSKDDSYICCNPKYMCNGLCYSSCVDNQKFICDKEFGGYCCGINQGLALDNTKKNKMCCNINYICNGLCYSPCVDTNAEFICNKEGGFCCQPGQKLALGIDGKSMCCDKDYICNNTCYSRCSDGQKFICDAVSGGLCSN
ncbi:MAG: PrsW family intramembrane metalloprotease [Bacteroidales bacterium]|nr:PrsW family intramembrane metalloprotease [Bacteroidales bacterium]